MIGIRMALRVFRSDLRAFLRNRQSRFFTLALPVLFLVIFASVFGGHDNTVAVAGGSPSRCPTSPGSSPSGSSRRRS